MSSPRMQKLKWAFQKPAVQTALQILLSMISAAAFARFYNFSTANITTLVMGLLMFPVYKAAFSLSDRKCTVTGILCGLFFALCMFMYKYEWLTTQELHKGLYAVEFSVGFTAFFCALSIVLLSKLRGIRLNTPGAEPPAKNRRILFFASAAVMLVLWLPYYLLAYPSVITADSINQLNQAVKDAELSNHHPVVHTAVIRLCYQLGFALFHDETKAVATYTVLQMLVTAACFSYLVVTLYRFRIKKPVIACVLACYAVLAYHGTYSVTMWKDIPFALFVLTYIVTLWRTFLFALRGEKKTRPFELVMLFFTGFGICLFRSNGLAAYAVVVIFLAVFCFRRRKAVLAAVSVVPLILALIVKGPVYNALGIKKASPIEGLGIPQQMIARVLVNDRYLTEEQRTLISNVADIEGIRSHYWPNSADGVKFYIWENGNDQFVAEHKGEFLKLWIDLGLQYPSDYLIAYVYSTTGYWYPDVQNWLYGDEFHSDNFETLHHEEKMTPEHAQALRDWRNSYKTFYFAGLLWSIAGMFWLVIFMTGACSLNREKHLLLLYLPAICVWGTLMIAAPVYAEFRYAYSITASVPLLCLIPFVSHEGLAPRRTAAPAAKPDEVKPDEAKPDEAKPDEAKPENGKKTKKKS